jgi:superfamily II RNA helicase
VSLLEKGIGIHHSGMMPILREIVELMISKKYIKLLFATESFAIGLDCPIRTAIFTSLTKFDGSGERYLHAHEYTQMAGRAGRRGIDTVGHVVHCNNLFSPPALSDLKRILGGVPQTLVSKFHISYGLILNLMKHGHTSGFHTFSEKSMIQKEIRTSIQADKDAMDQLADKLRSLWMVVQANRTSKTVCDEFLELEEKLKSAVNKKRKDIERQLNALYDEHKNLKQDLVKVLELHSMDAEYSKLKESVEFMEQYIRNQTNSVCTIMIERGFIVVDESNSTQYTLTKMGSIASTIAEIHPLPFTEIMLDHAYFADFDAKRLVGLFSCFTDVKVPSDMRFTIPHTDDGVLKKAIDELNALYLYYETKETNSDVRTGIRYDNALMFDMIDYAMNWCDCTTEEECKYFIQSVISEKEISIGDFTKAMMKIVTISKEIMNVCEMVGAVDLKYKLNQIEGLVLKYVLTSQSLYI